MPCNRCDGRRLSFRGRADNGKASHMANSKTLQMPDASGEFFFYTGAERILFEAVRTRRPSRNGPMALGPMPETTFTFQPMDRAHAREIIEWQYEPPYDVYDLGSGDAKAVLRDLLDPTHAYHVLLSAEGVLEAYCCFGADARVPGGDYSADALDIGLGVRPDRTGQGRGIVYLQAVLGYARRTYAPRVCRVTVAAFNERALRVWCKAGLRPVQRFEREGDGQAFLVLVREEARPGDDIPHV